MSTLLSLYKQLREGAETLKKPPVTTHWNQDYEDWFLGWLQAVGVALITVYTDAQEAVDLRKDDNLITAWTIIKERYDDVNVTTLSFSPNDSNNHIFFVTLALAAAGFEGLRHENNRAWDQVKRDLMRSLGGETLSKEAHELAEAVAGELTTKAPEHPATAVARKLANQPHT